MIRTYLLCLIIAMLFPARAILAQEQPEIKEFTLEISKANASITVDGILDEMAWESASVTSDFLNKWPRDEGFAINQTQARIMYDDEFLYIAAINYQKKEDLVIATLKRDNLSYHWGSDGFSVILDPYNNKTNGFIFGVNAAGARIDGIVSLENAQTRPDVNWDNVWLSEVRIHDEYWVAEIAIPFKSLNFDPKTDQWGINFVRSDMKRNEFSTWSYVPQGFPGIDLGHLGTLQLNEKLPDKRQKIALQPYVLTSGGQNFADNEDFKGDLDIGLDTKIPIGSNFKMDLTLNPDFSTVDVDQQVTNLTRFSIRFPEKRAFFLENSDLFSSFGSWGVKPFFSRTIGLNDGELVPILFGTRMTGNLSENSRVGFMNVQTRSMDDVVPNNYTVLAAQQTVFGRSNVKALITNRSGFENNQLNGNDFNRTIGAEFNYISANNLVRGNLRYHWSQTEENLSDASFAGATLYYDDGSFYIGGTADRLGDNYINELGFSQRSFQYDAARDTLIRTGFNYVNPWMGYAFRPESNWLNVFEISMWTVNSYETNGDFIDRATSMNYFISTLNYGSFTLRLRNNRVRLLYETDLIGGDEFLPQASYNYNYVTFGYNSDSRGRLTGSFDSSYGGFYNGTRLMVGGSLNVRAQPWGNFGVRYVGNRVELPGNYGEATLHLIGPQSEVSFSNRLSWSTFLQYNTQSENFNINSRVQWRFAPMSDLFLVYNDNYLTDGFAVQNRGLVFKMNYWLN
ncbi:MAG: carbohydrate binding family 9 domain-containing protein [Balneolales bacterium]|nr:carbohydrate binding family 9 domain-containing protein [Balneolales bacterium]